MIENRRRNIAVVLAGGTGKRAGFDVPKQFYFLRGRTVLEHAVERFCAMAVIDEVVIVSHRDHIGEVEQLAQQNSWKKVVAILQGGKERYDSSLAAVRHYEGQDVNLLFHDSARPLVCAKAVQRICDALQKHEAVAVGLPASDTIWQTEGERIVAIPDRSALMRAQTPQAFRGNVIAEAYQLALSDPTFSVTDDCGVVLRYLPNQPLHIVEGAEQMMKLTYASDLPFLERFLDTE